MAEARCARSHPCFHEWPLEDQRPLTLLRRLVIEIEDSIAQSRAVILSTRDAIELLERLEGRQFSNRSRSTAGRVPRGAFPVPATRPQRRLARRATRRKPWSRTR